MTCVLHGTCVALEGRGLLLTGPAGSGKSGVALQLMAIGASLVADDRAVISKRADRLEVSAPPNISGLIEARGIGILRAEPCERATLCAIVKLDTIETERLPPKRYMEILSVAVPVLHNVDGQYFAAGLLQFLKGGALDPDEHP